MQSKQNKFTFRLCRSSREVFMTFQTKTFTLGQLHVSVELMT